MPASTREVYLLLRARDEASRIVRGFSSELLRSAAQAQAAALRAEAATRRQTAAQLRANGATRQQVQSHIDAAKALEQQARQLEVNEQNARRFAQSLTAVAGALETAGIAITLVGGFSLKFFFDAAQQWAEYQRQVALTKTQVDGFAATLKDVSDIGLDIAGRIPVAFEQIQPALYDIFSSTSANLTQAKILLEGFSKAAVAGQTDIQTAARGTMSILNAYNIPLENVNHILDVQFELVRKGVGTYEEFANVFGRVVPAATRAGQSFETVAAMLAYMTRNGQSAAMASTSAARALEALTNPKTVQRLEQMGVKVRDAKGNFLPLLGVLTELRTKILKLPPADRVGALTELLKGAGGTIQARRFIEQVLLRSGELEDFRDLLTSMGNASGTMENAYSQMADTTASKTQLLSNKWMLLKLAVGEAATPILLQLVTAFSKALDWFNKLDPAMKKTITRFALFASAVAVVAGIALAFLGVLAGIVAAFVVGGTEILVTIGILSTLGVVFATLGASIALAWKKSEGIRQFFKDFKADTIELVGILKDFGTRLVTLFKDHMAPAIEAFGKVIEEKVIPPILEFRAKVWDDMRPKIVETFRIIGDIARFTFDFISTFIKQYVIPAIEQMTAWWQKNKEELQPLIDVLIQVGKWLAIVLAVLVAAGLIAALTALVTLAVAAYTAFAVFIANIKALKQAFEAVVIAAKAVWQFLKDLGKAVEDFFNGADNWLSDAGGKLVQGLINGMKSKLGAVADTARAIAGTILGFFPHSPAKTGPLSGNGSPFKSGQTISNMLASGMLDKLGIVSSATGTVASAASPYGSMTTQSMYQPPVGIAAGTTAPAMTKTNYVSVTVNTQEIDPRVTSAELGWELAGRL